MVKLTVSDMKPFVGSKNFAESRDFYTALGWHLNWDNGELAELELDDNKFYLQNYYKKVWCDNLMLHLTVQDAAAWYQHVITVLGNRKYGVARARAPIREDYGALVTYVWDPVGVLLHFAQPEETQHSNRK